MATVDMHCKREREKHQQCDGAAQAQLITQRDLQIRTRRAVEGSGLMMSSSPR